VAFDATSKFNAITFAMYDSYDPEDYMLLGNIRLAIGAADTRNKLITEGKFVTRGLLFDVNSDKIKPESAGALKDIADVLKENADVKIKIVGHTDADGDDAKNLDLSKRRAASVKSYLVSEFGISAGNIETDGEGESAPVDKNTTAEGKANNRRVEFIKM
jgi:outer membrane protein OmpA-like peptidoglycan-associated protein